MPIIEIPGKGRVQFPDTMSQEEIVGAVKKIATPAPPGPLMSSPKGFYGPGVLANLESRMTGGKTTPQEAYDKRVPQLETAAQLAGAAVAPGTGVLRQAAGQALMGSGLEAVKGTGPLKAAGKGLEAGGGALVAGGVGRGLFQPAYQKAAAAATKGFDEATTAAKQAHADGAAAKIASQLKKDVPALSPFSDDSKGLVDMIYGKGKATVSRAFDKAMKEVKEKHSGTPVLVPSEVADKYGLAHVGEKSPIKPTGKGLEGPRMVPVSGGELANAITGTWRKDYKSYKAAAEALVNAGVVDPKIGQAYKAYSGVAKYADLTGALKGETFNPEAWNAGLTKLKQVEELRRRGLGSATEGYGTLARGTPSVPPAPDVKVSQKAGPLAGGALGHMAGYGLGSMVGHPYMGSIAGGPLGAAAGKAMFPNGLVTQAPVSPTIQALIQALTKGGGAAGSVLGP